MAGTSWPHITISGSLLESLQELYLQIKNRNSFWNFMHAWTHLFKIVVSILSSLGGLFASKQSNTLLLRAAALDTLGMPRKLTIHPSNIVKILTALMKVFKRVQNQGNLSSSFRDATLWTIFQFDWLSKHVRTCPPKVVVLSKGKFNVYLHAKFQLYITLAS